MDKDYFGIAAEKYKLKRPEYSSVIINKIKKKLEERKSVHLRMLDIGTGSGQLAIALGSSFSQVYGLDISEKQISEASQRQDKPQNVKFQVFDCSQLQKFSEINEISNFDLITCGQCLHWFNGHNLFSQIKSLLHKESGLFVVLSYYKFNYQAKSEKGQEIIDIIQNYRVKLWPHFTHKPEELIGYPSYPFEEYFSHVKKQTLQIPFEISIDDIVQFMGTYSGAVNYYQKLGTKITEDIREELKSSLSEEDLQKLKEPCYFCKVSMEYSLIFAYL